MFWEKVSKNRMGSDKDVKRLTNGFENLIEECPSSSVEGSAKIT